MQRRQQRRPLDSVLDERLADKSAAGLRRTLLDVQPAEPGRVLLAGRSFLDFASNDYLGLGHRPDPGGDPGSARASRLVTGNLPVHRRAEQAFAEWVGLESALLFTSGYAANVGTVAGLMGRGDVVFSDELNHASLIDGSRLSRARIEIVPHRDLDALRRGLETCDAERILVITESIFSMEGTHADLAALRDMTTAHGAWLLVDEAHSLGTMGPEGRGSCVAAGVRPDILVGTLGKAMGSAGAFVAGSSSLRDALIHDARSFVFSTGIAPAVAAGLPARIDWLRQADEARALQAAHCGQLSDGLRALGIEVRGSGPILGAIYGAPEAAVEAEHRLAAAGILARAIRPPTVPRGTSRLRIVPSAAHTRQDIEAFLEALA